MSYVANSVILNAGHYEGDPVERTWFARLGLNKQEVPNPTKAALRLACAVAGRESPLFSTLVRIDQSRAMERGLTRTRTQALPIPRAAP